MNIEDIILTDSSRGMKEVRKGLQPGYCRRAADILLSGKGTILIGTGFPVKGSFETDGPIGAVALYLVLRKLGDMPVFVCAPPISDVLKKRYTTYELPLAGWEKTGTAVSEILAEYTPMSIVSIERPGVTADGRYYNMKGIDVSRSTAKFDLLFTESSCPTIAVGDGGNEIGMGNAADILKDLDIHPSVTCCDELIVSTVSNWGVYGIIAEMSIRSGTDLFDCFDLPETVTFFREQGSLDGITARPDETEDGFPVQKGMEIIQRLRRVIAERAH